MSPAIDRDLLGELSNAVAAYLTTMGVTADCLEKSFPEVGGPYRKRIHSLLSRVSFDATREAIANSAHVLQEDLQDYAAAANEVRIQRSLELERGVLALGDVVDKQTRRLEFFSDSLLKFAERLGEVGVLEGMPKMEGKRMLVMFAPKAKLSKRKQQEANRL